MSNLPPQTPDGLVGSVQGPFQWLDSAFDSLVWVVIGSVLAYVAWVAAAGHGFRFSQGSVSAQARDVLWFALLCGLCSFATVEIVKRLTPIRALYHRGSIAAWFAARSAPAAFEQLRLALGLAKDGPSSNDGRIGEEPPGFFRVEDEERRVFGLPAEQLIAQISSATDLVLLRDPEENTGQALIEGLAGAPIKASRDPEVVTRQAQQVRIGIDQLQITLATRWRRHLWGAAVALSGLYGIGLVYASHAHRGDQARHVLAALLIGGLIAGVARDLLAIVERLRS
jgi:hypothetical protein